ncbi:GAF and ANTAR domain-containing protein [Saccharomonospora sp. NPDC006951]
METLSARGAGLALAGTVGIFEPIWGSGSPADEIEELQATVGEGPGCDVLSLRQPVFAPDLGSRRSVSKWPVFAPAAARYGTNAMFSFPVGVGAAQVGVLNVYRATTGELSARELNDAYALADLALLLVLDHRGGISVGSGIGGDGDAVLRNVEVHQAAGMVSVQLGIPVVDALLRLRAHAFADNVRLTDLARAVVQRKLRFGRNGEHISESDPESDQ